MGTCRSCGQKIHWIETMAGKNMPCDMELVSVSECEPGDKLVTIRGVVVSVTGGQEDPEVKGYVSHWSTCPDADEWRNNAKSKAREPESSES